MKNILSLVFLFTAAISISQVGEEPISDVRKNSFGLDFRSDNQYVNIGFTYRKFFTDSKYNLRANISLGAKSENNPSFGRTLQMFETGDTNQPLLGINDSWGTNLAFQRLEIGFEKQLSIRKFNFIGGIDLTVGHSRISGFTTIEPMERVDFNENGLSSFHFRQRIPDSLSSGMVNSLSYSLHFLTVGANFRFGFKYDLSERFYATAFIGLRTELELAINESSRYDNQEHKERLSVPRALNTINMAPFSSVGIHYRF